MWLITTFYQPVGHIYNLSQKVVIAQSKFILLHHYMWCTPLQTKLVIYREYALSISLSHTHRHSLISFTFPWVVKQVTTRKVYEYINLTLYLKPCIMWKQLEYSWQQQQKKESWRKSCTSCLQNINDPSLLHTMTYHYICQNSTLK